MANVISFTNLITSGAGTGGLRRNCYPTMVPFIREVRKQRCIINLKATKNHYLKMAAAFKKLNSENKKILFVGTKPLIRKTLADLVGPTKHFYVNYRWLGGLLTNFDVLYRRIESLQKVRKLEENKIIEDWSKRDQMMFQKEKYRLERTLRGMAEMTKLPDCLVLIDPKTELTALAEAEKLGIPVYALTGLEINPDRFEGFIPLNDNSERALRLFLENLIFCLTGDIKEIEELLEEEKNTDFFTPIPTNLTDDSSLSSTSINQSESEATKTSAAPVSMEKPPIKNQKNKKEVTKNLNHE